MPVDLTAAPPPKRGPGRPRSAPVPSGPSPKELEYRETLGNLAQVSHVVLLFMGQHAHAGAVSAHTPQMIPAYARAATKSQAFGRLLDSANKAAGPWMEAAFDTLPFALQIGANLGLIQPNAQLGVMPPQMLEAQAKLQAAELQRQAAEQVAQAQAEIERMQREQAAQQSANGATPNADQWQTAPV